MAATLEATPAGAGIDLSQPLREAQADAARASSAGDVIKARMPNLVKGCTYAEGVNEPLRDQGQILMKASQATLDLRTAIYQGMTDRPSVVKNLSPDFLAQRGFLQTALNTPSPVEQIQKLLASMPGGADVAKSFTAGSLGIGTVSGLVPFDLVAPSRLIYPVYTVFRNKLPRPAGQGTARQAKVFTGISGSQTGGQGVVDISIPELVQSSGTMSASNWPMNLPPSGNQTEVDISVPYRFFGLTEALSWLAQFAGQGFEDVSALASLILLQEMMMGEEYAMLSHSSVKLSTPGQPTTTLRAAGSNETAIGGSPSHFVVAITATNFYGETVASAVSTDITTVGTANVVDVTIPSVPAALSYNIYVSENSATPTNGQLWKVATGVGGQRFTIQGPLTLASPATNPPTTDSGTGANTRMEGLIPTLTGLSSQASVYPSGWQGGYVNQSVGTHLSYNVIYTALDALWESVLTNPGAFKADPAELVGDGGDLMRLSTDVISQGAATNYRLFLDQSDVGGARVGAAVSEFQNPVTRSVLKLVVHPWLPQGNALFMTYQLPQTWTNVANAWEMTMVQDYVSIAWPVIDASFRYSLFMYGALVGYAPFYSGYLGGLQVSDTTPYK
jgi:hypothetical protein